MIEPLLQAERLLVHGLVEQAEVLYRRTLEADPRNSIAVVGLARIALERGDDRLAYSHACAALEIDAQNVAALRLEARLSEVLATRGEPVERPAWLAGAAPPALPAAPDVHSPAPEVEPPEVEPVPGPSEAPAATPGASASEQVMLTRNPSMADHRRRMDEERRQPSDPRPSPAADRQPAPAGAPRQTRRRPKGLLRRMLGL